MKRIFFIFILLMVTACSKSDYRARKKIVIRPVKKTIIISINFDFDKSDIRAVDQGKLDKFISKLESLRGNIGIEGHTDTWGNYSYNDELSFRRAVATKEYLEKTMNPDHYDIQISGRGEYDSLVEEKTTLDMLKNRRVKITFKENFKM
ncbi:MAG: hypothetical protein B6227_05640 [Fusobacteriia bacterium 4572_74]|nr:MAG: hypothetical protein B6227_05640 [Fusobacteriia bacterium 4572_74]